MTNGTYRVGIVGATGIAARAPGPAPAPFKSQTVSEMGVSHAASLAHVPRAELVAICDLVPDLLEQFKRDWGDRWPDTNVYTDYKEMLANERLDILTVATSDHRHADIMVDGANAGVKGIFCEKPLATTLEDADRMIRACEAKRVIVSVDYTRRWSPILHTVRETVRSGAIGRLRTVIVEHGGPRAMLFRNGTHLIDAVCFFVESEPVHVFARLEDGFEHWDRYRGDGGKLPENDPSASGLIIFDDGVRAFYCGSKSTVRESNSLQLLGDQGEVQLRGNAPTADLTTWDAGKSGDVVRRTIIPVQYRVQGIVAAYEELIDLIENGGTATSSAREARKTLQIMLGFLKSQQAGGLLVDVPE